MSELTCVSPVDGSVFATLQTHDLAEATSLIGAAREAQVAWRRVPLADRAAIVLAAIDALAVANDDIVVELAHLMGRPIRYGGEIGGVRERATHMVAIAEAALADTVIEDSADATRFISREPLGVVLVIAPWNYPYLTAINTIVPALMAGNAVAFKGSTQTLLTGERFADAFHVAGLPDGLFVNLFLTHDDTAALITAGQVDFTNFTGSVGAGRKIEAAASGTFSGTGLELGGKDPGYVCDDAGVATAAETLIDGAMFNSGQCCCGIERIYVHAAHFDEFVTRSVEIVNGYVLGDPLEEATTLGPMAHRRFADEVRDQVAEAVAAGATPLIDPKRFGADTGETAYLAPQILVDVDHSMRVMRDESFGPVVGIMAVSGDEEAIRLMNDSAFGLTASLWTADVDRARRIGEHIETGTIYMNRCDYLDPALCWTGCKNTGRGVSLSAFAYHGLTRPKSFHLKHKKGDD